MAENELIRESLWSREYRVGPQSFRFESKFVKEGLEVSADSVRRNWLLWGPAEQLSFATAFILKPVLSSEDQEILTFLMEHGSAPVWTMIARRLPQHSDRERAVSFLLARVLARDPYPANYFQALATMGDPRTIPALRQRYQEYRANLLPFEAHDFWSGITEYLACCGALWRLENSPEYEDAIRQLFSHPDAAVRRAAQIEYVDKKLHYLAPAGQPERPPPGPGQPDELLQETAWSRVYSGRVGYCWYASKFRTDGLQVAAASIRERWPSLELEEQVEFAEAFCQKPAFSEQDLQILQLLIEDGIEYTRTVVACQLGGHPGLETVLPFLLGRIGAPEQQAAKYYETLRLIGDARAVPPLRQRYEQYRKERTDLSKSTVEELFGYLLCCQALRALTGLTEYETALEELLTHPDELVRREVRRLLPRRKS
jgi:hypothetical protein